MPSWLSLETCLLIRQVLSPLIPIPLPAPRLPALPAPVRAGLLPAPRIAALLPAVCAQPLSRAQRVIDAFDERLRNTFTQALQAQLASYQPIPLFD